MPTKTREIKFRAWDDEKKEWLLGYGHKSLGGFNLMGELVVMNEWASTAWSYISDGKADYLKVMQYTGLKDKNGKEIYEGDIMTVSNIFLGKDRKMKVVWQNDLAKWYLTDGKAGHEFAPSHFGEVIGNIYENGDLLK